MSNQWLRLWHEMPNDPKWRTISRISNQPISLVLALYCHLLVDASRNVTRGHATVTSEDLASALDVTEEQIDSILHAMDGRVLAGMRLLGWDKRQPKREDSGDEKTGAKSAAQRKREQRIRDSYVDNKETETQCHELSRNVTLDKDTDKDTDKNIDKEHKCSLSASRSGLPDCPHQKLIDLWAKHLPHLTQPRVWDGNRRKTMRQRWVQASKPSEYSPNGYATEPDGIDWWDSFFGYIATRTNLANGFESQGRTWRPDLEWVCNAANFQKIIDGKYEK